MAKRTALTLVLARGLDGGLGGGYMVWTKKADRKENDIMGTMAVRDHVVWAKHIRGDAKLVHRILEMRAGETTMLVVDGIPGKWAKMADGPSGEATPGLKPVDSMKTVWGGYFRDRKDDVVEVQLVDKDATGEGGTQETAIKVAPPLARSEQERRSALRAFLDLAKRGWKSSEPYGPRDELYDR